MLFALELAGIFAFAVSGALMAARKGFDVVGSLLLAVLAGLGGGLLRDVLIAAGPPLVLRNPVLLIPVLLAVLAVFFGWLREGRLRRSLLVFDAAGLSLFCVTGTIIAAEAGLHPVACALLGVATAAGGGMLRDVVANEVPQIVNPRGVYAVWAMLGSSLTITAWELGIFGVITGIAIAVPVFVLRVLSLRLGWRIPLAGRAGPRPGERS